MFLRELRKNIAFRLGFGENLRKSQVQGMNSSNLDVDIYQLYEEFPALKAVERSGKHRLRLRKSVLRLAPKGGVGAELGVFTGLFSEVLSDVTAPRKLYLVDPWEKLHGDKFPNWGSYTANVSVSTIAARTAATVRAAKMESDCEVVTAFGGEWLSSFNDPFLDWVYLDASHDYEAVLNNLNHIAPRMRPDGVIMGDDCWVAPDRKCSGTYYAIRNFIADNDYEIIHMDGQGQWALSRLSSISKVSQNNK